MKIKVKILSVYFFLDAAKMSRLFFQTCLILSFIVFFLTARFKRIKSLYEYSWFVITDAI